MLVPADLEPAKIVQTAVYGGTLVAVEGSYDDVNRLCSELQETDAFESTAFVNVNVRPYYAEGSKTLGYEVAEQLGWRLPAAGRDPDGVRVAADQGRQGVRGAGRAGAGRGVALARCSGRSRPGARRSRPRSRVGRDVVEPVKPTGIAKSLNIGNPADGPYALDAVRRTGGAIADVGDEEIRDGIELLARTTGIFAETAGGVVVATLRRLLASGALDPAAETVIYNTGDGLKTLDAVGGRLARRSRSSRSCALLARPVSSTDLRGPPPPPRRPRPRAGCARPSGGSAARPGGGRPDRGRGRRRPSGAGAEPYPGRGRSRLKARDHVEAASRTTSAKQVCAGALPLRVVDTTVSGKSGREVVTPQSRGRCRSGPLSRRRVRGLTGTLASVAMSSIMAPAWPVWPRDGVGRAEPRLARGAGNSRSMISG